MDSIYHEKVCRLQSEHLKYLLLIGVTNYFQSLFILTFVYMCHLLVTNKADACIIVPIMRCRIFVAGFGHCVYIYIFISLYIPVVLLCLFFI